MKHFLIYFVTLVLFSISSNAQTVYFKPVTGNTDELNAKFGLKFDSIKIYSYALQKEKTVTIFDNVNLSDFSDVEDINFIENGISGIEFENNEVIISYNLPELSNYYSVKIYDISGDEIFSKIINSSEGKVHCEVNQLSSGIYFASLSGSNQVFSKKFIYPINSKYSNSLPKIFNKLPFFPEENTYKITAYSHNRLPITLDYLTPKDNDTIKIKFGYEYPYNFVEASINISFPNIGIKIYSSDHSGSSTFKSKGNSVSCNLVKTDYRNSNSTIVDTFLYEIRYGFNVNNLDFHISSPPHGVIHFIMLDDIDIIRGFYVSATYSTPLGNYNEQTTYSFHLRLNHVLNVPYTILDNKLKLILDSDKLPDLITDYNYSKSYSKSIYFRDKEETSDYNFTNSKIDILLTLF